MKNKRKWKIYLESLIIPSDFETRKKALQERLRSKYGKNKGG